MYKNADFIKRQRKIHLRTSRGPKTHKGLKRVTRVQCSWIFIFSKYHIWKPSPRPQKSKKFKNNFARASRFLVHFFVVTARLRHESALLWRANIQYSDFRFVFQNFDTVFRRSERDGKSEIKFEAARMHFLNDVCCSFRHRCCLSYLRFPPENVD